VRQAPVLVDNLAAMLDDRPLERYEPQSRWLAILHLGEREGLATWGPLWWHGRAALWLKDRIDRRWMARYET
jgi:selenide,water dikinase